MLKIIKIQNPSLRWTWLLERDLKTDCILVSDIKTKQSVEEIFLKKESFLPGLSVLRSYEFYEEIFNSLNIKWHTVSDTFIQEIFSEFCIKHKKTWVQNLHNSTSFFSFFNGFLPSLFYKESLSLFDEWFHKEKKPVFWKPWLNLAHDFFKVLESKKILHESGRKAFLLQHLSSVKALKFPKERIYMDLSFSLDLSEIEIFKELSRHREVFVLCPQFTSQNLSSVFEQEFHVYKNLEEELSIKHFFYLEDQREKQAFDRKVFRVQSETRIEELKTALVQVCQWLKQGIPAKDIALFAPHIEDYWFFLKNYFEKEKIPFAKSLFIKAIDYPEIRYFLSALRCHLSSFSFEDIENFCFFKSSKKDFSEFKKLYFSMPDRKLSKKLFFQNKILDPFQQMKGFEFINWACSFWPKEAPDFLWKKLCEQFLQIPNEESLRASSWLKIFELSLQNLDVELEKENQEGISCLSFNALFSTKSSYIYILGLEEQAFKEEKLPFLKDLEKKEILESLGFPLAFSYPNQRLHNLLWFLQSSDHKEVFLSFSSYNFDGDLQAKSLFYFLSDTLYSAKEKKIQGKLSWDVYREQKNLDGILKFFPHLEHLKSSFLNQNLAFFPKEEVTFSPSCWNLYFDCPFKYAVEKLFFVKDKEPINRELSALLKGSIFHALFELTLKKYPELNPTELEIEEVIEEVKREDTDFLYKNQWILLKEELKNTLSLFLIKEKEERKAFPNLKPVAFEQKILTFWNQEKGTLDSKGKYLFKAKVDRIDQDKKSGAYVVRDYKSSKGDKTHIQTWIQKEKEELQLTFYAQALQKGLGSELSANRILALFYSFYKEDFSKKGFAETSSYVEKIIGKSRRYHKEGRFLDQAILQSNLKVKALVERIEKGDFSPNPKNKRLCKQCPHQSWCRIETLKG